MLFKAARELGKRCAAVDGEDGLAGGVGGVEADGVVAGGGEAYAEGGGAGGVQPDTAPRERQPDGSVRLVVQGTTRIRLLEVVQTRPFLRARVEEVREIMPAPGDLEAEALTRNAKTLFQKIVELSPMAGNVGPTFLCAKLVYKILSYRFGRERR